jgi:SAM-dependent methyltransferase
MKLFRNSSRDSGPNQNAEPATRLSRRSNGLGEIAKVLSQQETLCILDLGSTSANNIRYFTERGHKIYSEDLLEASTDPSLATTNEQGNPALDSRKFLADNLTYPTGQFDIVLCWNFPDYLDESLVKPVVEKLWSVLKPGGLMLAFFHTREAGPDAVCYRYHVMGGDVLEMTPIELRKRGRGGSAIRLQRVFNNRHIENLFRDFSSIKFFLSRDNIREVLVVR